MCISVCVCVCVCDRFCFIRLSLLLIAIEARNEDGTESNISINPGPELKLDTHSQGFFIAESADDVKRCVTVCELTYLLIHCVPPPFPFGCICFVVLVMRKGGESS